MQLSDLSLITTSHLQVPHGFATRHGGMSEGVYASLNFGFSTGDKREYVEANREKLLRAFGVEAAQVCALQQVHSTRVVEAQPSWHELEADAAITNQPDLLLVISTADCLPILFHDPVQHIIGAAHAGWRGTVGRIAANVVEAMMSQGSSPTNIRVLIGPCIQGACYQVGPEVVAAFDSSGFPKIYQSDAEGRYRLDLVAATYFALEEAGILRDHMMSLEVCTHCKPERFYSHRRDGLKRGSHWSAIKLEARDRE